jgi:hypothetical protein
MPEHVPLGTDGACYPFGIRWIHTSVGYDLGNGIAMTDNGDLSGVGIGFELCAIPDVESSWSTVAYAIAWAVFIDWGAFRGWEEFTEGYATEGDATEGDTDKAFRAEDGHINLSISVERRR